MKNKAMSKLQIEEVLRYYESILSELEDADPKNLTETQILAVLVTRDKIHKTLENYPNNTISSLQKLIQLDDRLGKLESVLCKRGRLDEWRKIINPTSSAWWWKLSHPRNQWDYLWNNSSIVFLTVSLGLLTNIATRFLSGGPDAISAVSVSIQGVLGFLGAKVALTNTTEESVLGRLLKKAKIPLQWDQEIRFLISFLVFVSLFLSLKILVPKFSNYYLQKGVSDYDSGRLSSAQEKLKRSITLNPDNVVSHFYLGLVYEHLRQVEQARTQYQIASAGGIREAYNNLARLLILDKKYSEAIPLLLEGLKNTSKLTSVDSKGSEETTSAFHKNLGWARLSTKEYEEAQIELERATSLDTERASSYCLLAKTFEAKAEKENAFIQWNKCLSLATRYEPDGNEWIAQARKYLQSNEKTILLEPNLSIILKQIDKNEQEKSSRLADKLQNFKLQLGDYQSSSQRSFLNRDLGNRYSGEIFEIKGKVFLKQGNSSNYHRVFPGQSLKLGDVLRTGKGSKVIIQCRNSEVKWQLPSSLPAGAINGCPLGSINRRSIRALW